MNYYFTSESVSEGHPDKIADQISDSILDSFLAFDKNSKVACECLVTTGQVVLAGEIKSKAYVEIEKIARDTINKIGYNNSSYMFDAKSCGVLSAIHEQSQNINVGVEKSKKEEQGAGDQGIMFGYATNETIDYMPLCLSISHKILEELAIIRKENKIMTYLRPDAKSQITIEYNSNNEPVKIDTIVISTQHDEFDSDSKMQTKIKEDILKEVIPRVIEKLEKNSIKKLFNDQITYHINPTGKFVIGGPHGDTGLTGRKIIVDTYGGKGAHGGGAFSGKDPSKVDRSAAYAARHIAKNCVAAGVAKEIIIQLSYAIGVAQPTSIYVNTYGTANIDMSDEEIANIIAKNFDFKPYTILQRLKLLNPIYFETASYGHMGRKPQMVEKAFRYSDGKIKNIKVELFTWEKLDLVSKITKIFKLPQH